MDFCLNDPFAPPAGSPQHLWHRERVQPAEPHCRLWLVRTAVGSLRRIGRSRGTLLLHGNQRPQTGTAHFQWPFFTRTGFHKPVISFLYGEQKCSLTDPNTSRRTIYHEPHNVPLQLDSSSI